MALGEDRLVFEYLGAPRLRERGDRLLFDHLYRLALHYFELGDKRRLSSIYSTARSALDFLREEPLQMQWNLIQLMNVVMQHQRLHARVEQLSWAIDTVEMLARECHLESEAMDEFLISLNHKLHQAELEDPDTSSSTDLKQKLLKFIDCIPQSSPSSSYIQLLKASQDEETPLPCQTDAFLCREKIEEAFLSLSDSRTAASDAFEGLLRSNVLPPRRTKAAEPAPGAAASSPGPECRREDSPVPARSLAPARAVSATRQTPSAEKRVRPDRSRMDACAEREPERAIAESEDWERVLLMFFPPPLNDSEELVPMHLIAQDDWSKQSDGDEEMDTADFVPASYQSTPPVCHAAGGVAHPGSSPATDGRSRGNDNRRGVKERAARSLAQDREVAGPSKSSSSTLAVVTSPAKTTKFAPSISAMDGRGNERSRVAEKRAAPSLVQDREVAGPSKWSSSTLPVVTSSAKTTKLAPSMSAMDGRGNERSRVAEKRAAPSLAQDREVAGPSKRSTSTPAVVTSLAQTTSGTFEPNGRFPGDGFSPSQRQQPHAGTTREAKEEWWDEEELFGASSGKYPRTSSSARKKTWTQCETQCLKEGVAKFGVGNWNKIKMHYSLNRSNVQLKDRWRNISK